MKVSLIIAAYNRGPRIAKTLDSVLAQLSDIAEIIVVDDGSTDDTASFVQLNYPTIRLEQIENQGPSGARNHGARIAQHDTLIFLDSDDALLPDAVNVLTRMLDEMPEAQAAFADHAVVNLITGVNYKNHHGQMPSFQRLRHWPIIQQHNGARMHFGSAIYRSLLKGNVLQQPWAVRRSAFQSLGGFDESLKSSVDWDLYLRLVRYAPIALTDTVIAVHFIEPGKQHVSVDPSQEEMQFRILHKHLANMGLCEIGARRVACKKIAMHHKVLGDRAVTTNRTRAFKEYWQSFCYWPFDVAVGVRLITWSVSLGIRAFTASKLRPET